MIWWMCLCFWVWVWCGCVGVCEQEHPVHRQRTCENDCGRHAKENKMEIESRSSRENQLELDQKGVAAFQEFPSSVSMSLAKVKETRGLSFVTAHLNGLRGERAQRKMLAGRQIIAPIALHCVRAYPVSPIQRHFLGSCTARTVAATRPDRGKWSSRILRES
jgi:hypothetical protein